jgi:hypothetical protein
MARLQDYRPKTLSGLEKHQVAVLITCLACNRYVPVPTVKLIARLGRGVPVPEVARHYRCQRCGGGIVSLNALTSIASSV